MSACAFEKQVLRYVKNTGGGATKAIFIDDFAPVGQKLWDTYFEAQAYITVDPAGKIWLTALGGQRLVDLL